MKYLEFLRYALDEGQGVPEGLDQMDWEGLYLFAEQQSIVGVMFEGIQRLGSTVAIPRPLLMQWVGRVQQIEVRNAQLNRVCVELSEMLRQEGFECCILKGQGNALMYPNPYSRTSGDIDVWVRKVRGERGEKYSVESLEFRDSLRWLGGERCEVREVIRWVRERNPKGKACYHHIDYGEFKGVEVEVHYRPSFMNNLIHNKRLQRWFEEQAEEQFAHQMELPDGTGSVCVPTRDFNIIFQLSHIYNHVLHEGIGLRQVVDYYFLLRGERGVKFRVESLEFRDTLRWMGLEKFAGALMWVLSEVLGLEDAYLIAPKDERLGRVLLSEMMRGGNFGHYDEDNIKADNQLKKNWQRIKRDFRLMRFFPSEALWEPVFRVWHFGWRMWVKLRV